jgi:hypothetical protein
VWLFFYKTFLKISAQKFFYVTGIVYISSIIKSNKDMSYIEQKRMSVTDPGWDSYYKVAVQLYKGTKLSIPQIAERIGVHYRTVNVMIYDFYFKTKDHVRRT